VWLPWDIAAVGAMLLLVPGFAFAGTEGRLGAAAAVAREAAIVAVLYSLWQLAGHLSVVHLEGAIGRAEWLWDLERTFQLPDEGVWQRALLPHGWSVQAANIYYGGAHVPAMGIFLVWMFFRHRVAYPQWRNAVAWLTGWCLVVQLLPVAPPRLVDELGIVDTGHLYGQSVYSTFGETVAGQLQAMPSIHVGWAVLIAVAAMRVSSSPWRWVAVAHAAATSYVVVVTGNHFWADGIAAVAILAAILIAQDRVTRRRSALVEPPRSLHSVIGEDQVGAGTPNPGEGLEHDRTLVEPSSR